MIVVTGATGGLGSATVEHLLERVPADQIGVSVRDVDKARSFADRGVRVRQGSYDDPAGLRHAFEGAEQVMLVSGNDPTADLVGQHRNAIEAAVAVGARRIFYTSQHGAIPGNPYSPSEFHSDTEAILAESGVAWTAVRNAAYGPVGQLFGPWQQTSTIAQPEDGPVPYTDRAEVAEGIAAMLAGDRAFDGPVDLTAPNAITFADAAKIATELTGRTIERVVLDDEQWVADQIAAGVPEQVARLLLGFYQASREGYFAQTSSLLTELLGREPSSVTDRLASHINA